MGLPPVKLERMREYIEMCRKLLRGEEVMYREGKRERAIRFLHPNHGYINLKDPIPIHVAANGPKALEPQAGSVTNRITALSDPDHIRADFKHIEAGAARAGRKLRDFPAMLLTSACVLKPGESAASPRAITRVGRSRSCCCMRCGRHPRSRRRHPRRSRSHGSATATSAWRK